LRTQIPEAGICPRLPSAFLRFQAMTKSGLVCDGRRREARRSGKLAPLAQLRTLRVAVGLSRRGLARKVGVSHALLELLEKGYRPRTVGVVDAIATALRVAPAVLSAERLEISVRGGALVVAVPSENASSRRAIE